METFCSSNFACWKPPGSTRSSLSSSSSKSAAEAAAAAAASKMSGRSCIDETHRNLQAVLQYLHACGFSAAAAAVEKESGVSYIPQFFDIPDTWLQQQQQQPLLATDEDDDDELLLLLLQGEKVLPAAMKTLEQKAAVLRSSRKHRPAGAAVAAARTPGAAAAAACVPPQDMLDSFDLLRPLNGTYVLPPQQQRQQQQQRRGDEKAAVAAAAAAVAAVWGDLDERGRRCCCSRPLKLAVVPSSSSISSSSSHSDALRNAVYAQQYNVLCCAFIDIPTSSSSSEALLAIGSADKSVRLLRICLEGPISSTSSSSCTVASCKVACEWRAFSTPIISIAVRSDSSSSSSSNGSSKCNGSGSSDGSFKLPFIAVGLLDGTVCLLEAELPQQPAAAAAAEGRVLQQLKAHSKAAIGCEFGSKGSRLVSIARDGSVAVLRLQVPDVDCYATPCLALSPDGGYLYVTTQRIVGAEVMVYAFPDAAAGAAIAASPGGAPLLQPAAAAAVLRGPQQQIKGVACHPRLRILATVGLDKAVHLFY